MARTWTAIGLLALTLPGVASACNKGDAGGSPPAAASASGAAAASAPAPPPPPAASSAESAPPPPKCPAGLTGNAVPAYCIKLPGTYAVKQARVGVNRGSIDYDTGSATDNLTISYDESPIAQMSKDVESELKFGGDKLQKKGNLAGGAKWFQGSHADFQRIVTLMKGPGALTLKCSFAYQPKKPPPKEAIDACRSIVVP
jgi:hypothetical protein